MADDFELSAEAAREALRGAGLRGTSCRIAVLRLLADADMPLSHNEAADALTERGFDRSTVYRSLVELADAELLARLDLGDQVRRYEFRDDTHESPERHAHFMCVDCGEIACMTDFRVTVNRRRGRNNDPPEITEVMLKGRCGKCVAG